MAKNVNQEELQEEVVARPTVTEWIEKNATWISWTILGILIVICGIIAVNKYVLQPKAIEASNENAKAVIYFESGNYEKALNGDDIDCLGFAEIAKKYSHYQQGKLAALYAGISEYKLGNYEEAATYLKKFSADDPQIWAAYRNDPVALPAYPLPVPHFPHLQFFYRYPAFALHSQYRPAE